MKTLEPKKLIVRCTSCEEEHDAGKVSVIKTIKTLSPPKERTRSNHVDGGDLVNYICPSCKQESNSLVLGAKVSHYS